MCIVVAAVVNVVDADVVKNVVMKILAVIGRKDIVCVGGGDAVKRRMHAFVVVVLVFAFSTAGCIYIRSIMMNCFD